MTLGHDRARSSVRGRRDASAGRGLTGEREAAGCGSGRVRCRCSGLAEFPHFYPGAGGAAEGCGPGRGAREADGRPRAAVSVRLPCRFTRVRVTGRSRWEDGPAPQDVELSSLGYNQKHITPRFLYVFRVLLLRSAAGRSRGDRSRSPDRRRSAFARSRTSPAELSPSLSRRTAASDSGKVTVEEVSTAAKTRKPAGFADEIAHLVPGGDAERKKKPNKRIKK